MENGDCVRQRRQAQRAIAELESILREVRSDDVRETVEFALNAWRARLAALEPESGEEP